MTDQTLTRMLLLRRAIVGGRQFRQQVWVIGLVLVAVSVVLDLDGLWVAGIPLILVAAGSLWLSGTWVLAGTRDSYIRRLMRFWRSCATETRVSYDAFRAWERSFPSRLRSLRPPDGRAAEHERLVSLIEEEHQLRAKGSASAGDARVVAAAHRAARASAAGLVASTTSADDRAYVTALHTLFDERDAEYASTTSSVEHATSVVIRKLSEIKPPTSALEEHDRLVAAFRYHLAAQRELHAAVLAADPDRVGEAAAGWESSVGELRDALTRITNELDFYDRWPVPAVTVRHSGATVAPD